MIPTIKALQDNAKFVTVVLPSNRRMYDLHGYMASHQSGDEDEVIDLNRASAQRVTDMYEDMAAYDRMMQREDSRQAAEAEAAE